MCLWSVAVAAAAITAPSLVLEDAASLVLVLEDAASLVLVAAASMRLRSVAVAATMTERWLPPAVAWPWLLLEISPLAAVKHASLPVAYRNASLVLLLAILILVRIRNRLRRRRRLVQC